VIKGGRKRKEEKEGKVISTGSVSKYCFHLRKGSASRKEEEDPCKSVGRNL